MEVSNQHVCFGQLSFFFSHTLEKLSSSSLEALKIYQLEQEKQIERGRWNSKKKMWKGILGQGILCPIVLFCFVYINFSSSRLCFQEILMLNVIIYR